MNLLQILPSLESVYRKKPQIKNWGKKINKNGVALIAFEITFIQMYELNKILFKLKIKKISYIL